MEWISTQEKLPTLNEEYLVVWDLKDGQKPVVTSMDFNVEMQAFGDPRGTGEPKLTIDEILFWGELPEGPDIEIKSEIEPAKPISIDEMERLEYGQCTHGVNPARCEICNPHKDEE